MDDRTERFLEAALERGLVTADQVEECRKIRETVAEVGVDQAIDEILVRKGYLTPDQVRQLNRGISVKKVGKYQVMEKLGEGGAGIVYKANQEPLERVVAIKVLSKRRAGSEKYLERFEREARVAVTLNHQNIVRGLDYGEADGYHYFVMEYVEGDSLYSILKREGVLEEKQALEIVLQVLAALEHAAKYDLVHRDIKPENILITKDDVVKLCDLGLAKPSLLETAKASRDGTTIGTPTYMSPEQIRGKDETDFRSDVYSLGATLYHMVTGTPPFTGESADIIVRKHLREPVTDPRERNLKVGSGAASVIMKMLAKKPEERYASLADLTEDVKAVLDGRPPRHTIQLGGRPSVAPSKVHVAAEDPSVRRARLAEARRRSRLITSLGVVGFLVVVAVVVFVFVKPFGAASRPRGSHGFTVVAKRSTPPTPTPESLAKAAFEKAKSYVDQHPDISYDAKVAAFKAVVNKFPGTRNALLASDEMKKYEGRKAAAARLKAKHEEEVFQNRLNVAASLVKTGNYGDAIQALAKVPDELAGTKYSTRLAKEAEKLAKEAKGKKDAAIEKAEALCKKGQYDQAVAELHKLDGSGISSIQSALEDEEAKIREARKAEEAARERGRKRYSAAVGSAFLTAAAGHWQVALDSLQAAGTRGDLVYFASELHRALKALKAAQRFAQTLPKAADLLKGKFEKVALNDPSRPVAAGNVAGGNAAGIRFARAHADEVVPWSSISPLDLVRIGFNALNPSRPDDHLAAALYLVVNGHFDASEAEIKAASVEGADTAAAESIRSTFEKYLKDRADVEILRAEDLMSRHQLDDARDLLSKTVSRTPWYGRPHYFLGAVLAELGMYRDSLPELEKARDLGVKEPRLEYYLGSACYHLGKSEDALHAYSAYAAAGDTDPDTLAKVRGRIAELRAKALKAKIREYADKGRAAFRRRKWQEAVEIYEKLNDLSPNAEDALYFLGRANEGLGRPLDAWVRYRAYLAAAPTGGRSGEVRRRIRNLEKKYKDDAAIGYAVNKGLTAYDQGDYVVALTWFDQAVQKGQLSASAWYDRYRAHEKLGEISGKTSDFEAALDDLRNFGMLDPKSGSLPAGRALVLYYLHRYDESLSEARRAIDLLPDQWQSYDIAGLVLVQKGKVDEGVKLYTKAMDKAPKEPTLYINRAKAYEILKEYDLALKDLRSAEKMNPSKALLAEIQETLAEVIEKQKGS